MPPAAADIHCTPPEGLQEQGARFFPQQTSGEQSPTRMGSLPSFIVTSAPCTYDASLQAAASDSLGGRTAVTSRSDLNDGRPAPRESTVSATAAGMRGGSLQAAVSDLPGGRTTPSGSGDLNDGPPLGPRLASLRFQRPLLAPLAALLLLRLRY
eukprot:1409087-Pyramimonas_sp.AAC.1